MIHADEHVFERPIGVFRRKRSLDEVVGGSARGLSFRLRWAAPGSAEGDLTISLQGTQVWATAPQKLISSDWAEFLMGLSRAWLYLRLEETYPRGVVPEIPSRLETALLIKIINPEVTAAEFGSFRGHHNLSAWFKPHTGFSQMWMIREGNLMLLEGGNRVVRWAYSDVIRTLEHLGLMIAERLAAISTIGTKMAIESWQRREDATDAELEAISLGITRQRLASLNNAVPPRTRSEIFRGVDEVRAAARMLLASVDNNVILAVKELIRSHPHNITPELSKRSTQALKVLSEVSGDSPRNQGRHVAMRVREILEKSDQNRVDPERFLKNWNVDVLRFSTDPQIEAISFWGPSHGPAVLLNSAGRRNWQLSEAWYGMSGGARFTLAHEICHLLLDTEGSLPVAEVLGGSVPNALEERANAFAAEFLLPESAAGQAYKNHATVEEALNSLTKKYGVTKTLAAWQILKCFGEGSTVLVQDDFRLLGKITSKHRLG